MKLTLDISVQEVDGFPQTMLTVMTETKVVSIPFEKKLTLEEMLCHAKKGEENTLPLGSVIFKKSNETNAEAMSRASSEVPKKPDPYIHENGITEPEEDSAKAVKKDQSNEIQKEDLIQVTNMIHGLKGMDGSELIDRGIVQGGIYRVAKINQVSLVMPDKPDELTVIVQTYEVIDDKSAIPRRLSVSPQEVSLFKKRLKNKSVKIKKMSEFLKCEKCGEMNALVLEGNNFVGTCGGCGEKVDIERVIENCTNDKCRDSSGARTKVSLFLYGEEFSGVCGTCRASISHRRELLASSPQVGSGQRRIPRRRIRLNWLDATKPYSPEWTVSLFSKT